MTLPNFNTHLPVVNINGYGLSDYSHNDYDKFLDNFKFNKSHSFLDTKFFILTVANNWERPNTATTTIELPNFMDYTCDIANPDNTNDDCLRYTIKSGDTKQLLFNITVGLNAKSKQEICFLTQTSQKSWLFFTNKRRNCIDITITQ